MPINRHEPYSGGEGKGNRERGVDAYAIYLIRGTGFGLRKYM